MSFVVALYVATMSEDNDDDDEITHSTDVENLEWIIHFSLCLVGNCFICQEATKRPSN